MTQPKFSLTIPDVALEQLVSQASHQTLAIWAKDCALRVQPLLDAEFPTEERPRQALETLQDWIETGQFRMSVIRSASLNALAAARQIDAESPARSAARSAGQAAATAHVPTHALGTAKYAQQAVFRAAAKPEEGLAAAAKERYWQFRHLEELIKERQL